MNSVILETQASRSGGQPVSSSGNIGSEASLCRMGATGLNQKGGIISSQGAEFTSVSTGTLNTFGDTGFIF